ncbi:hypothetical protein ACET3Z_023445 [Daucus carota]
MEEKGIDWDRFTYCIVLATYSASCSAEDIDVIVQKMESKLEYLDWDAYTSTADAYVRVGCVDKATMMLKKSEGLIQASKRKSLGYESLIRHYIIYAAMGNKAEVLRLWEVYQNNGKIYNSRYRSMIVSLLKLDDMTGAENVFEEWEQSQLTYFSLISNLLVSCYCRKGLVGKAEALVERAIQADKKPSYHTCDLEEAKEFKRSLAAKDIISTDIEKEFLNYLENDNEEFNMQEKIPQDIEAAAT